MSSATTPPQLDTSCIGFVGLGIMGSPTVKNLLKQGYNVVVYDVVQHKVQELAQEGAIPTSSIKELASKCTCLFTMIPGPKELNEVYLGSNGLLTNLLHQGTYMFECSTVGPKSLDKVISASKEAGHIFLDCPISGGEQGAHNGTLTFMVGASDEVFNNVQPFLTKLGNNIIHAGPTGSAQAVKICNNACFMVNMMGTIEGYKLAKKLGADLQKFTDVLNSSTGKSFVSDVYNPCPNVTPNSVSNKDYEGGYSLSLALKDLHIAQDLAEEFGMNLETINAVEALYSKASNEGLENLDFGAYYKYYY